MGYMLIHCAASGGHLPLVKYFNELESGMNVNTKAEVSIVRIDSLFIYIDP